MSKDRPLLKAIFNSANLNGVGALLMSADVGTSWSTYLYAAAVTAGTYNKYHSLTKGKGAHKNPVLHVLTHPTVTAWAFMFAAGWNLSNVAYNAAQPDGMTAANMFFMLGWSSALLGDNAVRRNDGTNFQKDANALGASYTSKLKKTFNALVSNPTLFYGWASTGLVMAELAHRTDAAGRHIGMFAGPEGALGAATGALVCAGTAYALRRTWQAAQDKITVERINDGAMNTMAFFAKLGYTALAAANGQYGLAGGHLLFAISSLKNIYETRAALGKKAEPAADAPPPLPAPPRPPASP